MTEFSLVLSICSFGFGGGGRRWSPISVYDWVYAINTYYYKKQKVMWKKSDHKKVGHLYKAAVWQPLQTLS